MTAQLLVVLALLELEDEDLVALELINDGSNNLGLASLSRISNNLGAVDNSDSLQLNLVANFALKLLGDEDVASSNLVLLATSLNDSVQVCFSLVLRGSHEPLRLLRLPFVQRT